MPANPTYTDGSYAAAFATSLPVFSAPFAAEGVTANYLLTQKWCQQLASFAPLALDTAHPDYPNYGLASESEKADLGGGMVEWTRTYAQLPDSFSRPGGNYSFTFPQIIGIVGVGPNNYGYTQRFGFTKAVAVKRTLDFFRTATPLTIALIPAFRIYFLDEPLLEQSYVSDANSYSGETVPTATEYAALVTADETVDSYSLVTEMSRLTQWQGNIWQRETLYVKAQ